MTQVLLVGDEPQMLRTLRINLEARRYRVTTANDGAVALHRTVDNPPDLVLLDFPFWVQTVWISSERCATRPPSRSSCSSADPAAGTESPRSTPAPTTT